MKRIPLWRSLTLIALGIILLAGAWLIISRDSKPAASRLTVLVSSNTLGYIKNCGCSSGQFGGELRKARLLRMEREAARRPMPADKGRAAEVLMIDTGNFVDHTSEGKRINSEGVVRSMTLLDYDVVGLGRNELSSGQEALVEMVRDAGLPLTAANLTFVPPAEGGDASHELNGLIEPWRLVTMPGGFRVGVIHVIDTNVLRTDREALGIELTDAAEAVRAILKEHKREAGFWVLTIADSRREGTSPVSIAKFTDISLVIGFKDSNPLEDKHSNKALFPVFIDEPYLKAKDIVRVVAYFRPGGSPPIITADRLAIKGSYNPDPDVQRIIDELAPRLEQLVNEEAEEALNEPQLHPYYVSHETCGTCHRAIYGQLSHTKHSHAFESLIVQGERGEKNPNCLPCHVVGYNQPKGWNALHDPVYMRGVHCENCHGPGEYHVQVVSSGEIPDDLTADGRNVLGLLPTSTKDCISCHDKENSVSFDLRTYWPKIKHSID